MEGEFQYQGHIDQYLKDWLSPIWIQSDCGFFYDEQKQESIHIEDLDLNGEIISNQAPKGEISTMVSVKQSDKVEGPG